ncbi:MAG: hypothetical protein V4660_15300 [Pseudomonadota bacterium]
MSIKNLFLTRIVFAIFFYAFAADVHAAAILYAGSAKIEISDRSGPVNDPAYAKALVLKQGSKLLVLVTLDAVALAEIGRIPNSFMSDVRKKLKDELNIDPRNIVITASHSHSIVRNDVADLTVKVVKNAFAKFTAVRIGSGATQESRISENRRIKLKDGSETDVRMAYSLPADDQIVAVGNIDPNVGVLRIDTLGGAPFAVLYNFAAHPILGIPSGANTADYPGFASQIIEDSLGEGVIAYFLQGAAGDINPRKYKDIHQPRDAEPMGGRLAADVLRVWKQIEVKRGAGLQVTRELLNLPLAEDLKSRIEKNEKQQAELLSSINGSSLDFRSFIELYMQRLANSQYPSASKYRYLQENSLGISDLTNLDLEKSRNMEAYMDNIYIMEQLTRLKTNIDLLKKHEINIAKSKQNSIEVEVIGVRIGDVRMVTFPGEISVDIGLGIKERAGGKDVYVVGYTNGYIYYTPTAVQKQNTGFAQEDCESLVAPEWQEKFETAASKVLEHLLQ